MSQQEIFEQSADFQPETVETSTVKCENCGGNLVYDADLNMLSCPHCGTTLQIQQSKAKELDLLTAFDLDREWKKEDASVFSCDNCGAKIVLKAGETAKDCPFCGTAHVQKTEELVGIKPNAVLPFKFGVSKAVEYSTAWAKKKLFAPSKFKKNIDTNNVKGLYAPCFTFDSNTYSVYNGRIGKTHTRKVGSGKNARTQTYVVWRNISGTYSSSFNDVLITAGSKFNQTQLNKISPFDTENSVEYEENYLLGYAAYHYDYEVTDCWDSAKAVIDGSLKKQILSQYVYDRVAYFNVSTKHERVSYKYVMLPVYVGNFNYKKKLYNFYVNGTTGKVKGKTPKSALRILLAVLLGIAVVAGIVALKLLSGE